MFVSKKPVSTADHALFRAFAVVPDQPADRSKLVAGGRPRLRF
jgi:hypothetical protein